MTTSMQAVICEGPRDYRLDEIPVPRPGPGEDHSHITIAHERLGPCAHQQGSHVICCTTQSIALEKIREGRHCQYHQYRQHSDRHHQFDQREAS